jgi:hypothetical protein
LYWHLHECILHHVCVVLYDGFYIHVYGSMEGTIKFNSIQLKEIMSPYVIRNTYYSNLQSCLRYGIILWGGDNESNNNF